MKANFDTDAQFEIHDEIREPSLLASVDVSGLGQPSARTRKRQVDAGEFFVGEGLREIARYGGYSTYRPPGHFDPWVKESLKLFDNDKLESLRGFTRRGEGTEGIYKSLYKFNVPVKRFNSLSSYQRQSMKTAIAKARAAFKLPYKQEPLDWHEVGPYLRRDTSAGVSFPGKRKGDVMPDIYEKARWLGHRMKGSGKQSFDPTRVQMPPCLAGMRGHLSPLDEVKTRLVWIYPAELLVVEGHYAPRMYHALMELPNTPLLSGKSSQRLYTEWLVNLREGELLHGLDFKAFDTGVPPWLVHTAFDILSQNISWDTWRGAEVSKRDQKKWKNVWDGMKWYFINTPILMPDGRMFRKSTGVPSGSWFTQLIDSVVNYILVQYLAGCQGVEIRNLKVLGDDSGFRSTERMSLELAQNDASCVAMNISVEKCIITSEPSEFKLLGTRYANGHAIREDEEWFKLALYPENVPPDIGVSMTRLVGLWLGGAMWSMEFQRFFEFFQTCYPIPSNGWFQKDTRRWLEILHGSKAPRGWTTSSSLFWKSIFYVL